MKPDNIIFVKHGDKYSAEHVNRLRDQLMKYYKCAYICYTDDPIGVEIECIPCFEKPTLNLWWNKLAMFSKDFPVKGKCLYFDLDMDIKSNPSDFIKDFEGLTIINAYWKRDKFMRKHAYDVRINSSIIAWTAGEQDYIWKHFLTNKDYFMRKYKGIDRFLVHENIHYKIFNDGIVNSVANPYGEQTPIDMYNGINYDLQRTFVS